MLHATSGKIFSHVLNQEFSLIPSNFQGKPELTFRTLVACKPHLHYATQAVAELDFFWRKNKSLVFLPWVGYRERVSDINQEQRDGHSRDRKHVRGFITDILSTRSVT